MKYSKPYEDTNLVRYLQRRIAQLKPSKTQTSIAMQAGFKQPTMLANIKAGTSRLPLDRVPALARALECDPGRLFQLAFEQFDTSTTETAIKQIFGAIVSQNEAAWLEELRAASGGSDPHLTAKGRAAIRGVFGK
jgi:hypothetical protein